MGVATVAHPRRDEGRGELAVRCSERQQLAAEIAFGRSALVDLDVRGVRTDDGLVRTHDELQREHVRGAAGEHGRSRDGREPLADELHRLRGPRIAAVARRTSRVGGDDGGEHGRMRTGGVVGGDIFERLHAGPR